MKKVLAPLCLLILLSCSPRKQNNETRQTNVPKALNESGENKLAVYSKRGEDDLVEKLFEEKLNSTPALQEIESMITKLAEARNDSLEVYNDFNSKNLQYYNSAERHLSRIKDSLLEKDIKIIMDKSIADYNNRTSAHKNLIENLNKKPGSVDDRHAALKIIVSLGMMKEYQQGNMPSSKPIEGAIKDHDRVIHKLDSAIRKNK